MDVDQRLSDLLERLETGEELGEIVAGLPEDEGELVHLAAQIIAIPKPVRDPKIVRAQYQDVVRAAQASKARSSRFTWSFTWWLPAGVFLLLFVALAGIWMSTQWVSWQVHSSSGEVAENTTTQINTTRVPDLGETPGTASTLLPPVQPDNPQKAMLFSVHGIVQVKAKDGSWQTVQTAELQAGQTFRTWELSSAEMVFFDGSLVTLDQNTQMTLEVVNFEDPGTRQISLFQSEGESQHTLVPAKADNSFYLVQTPNASGEAVGTSFQVTVDEAQGSRFLVREGAVLVRGKQAAVTLTPGEITIVKSDGAPSTPVLAVTGEGAVDEIGSVWVINGAAFQTDEETMVLGKPTLGDVVTVQGRLMADGSRLADVIEKKASGSRMSFNMAGVVDEMGVSYWILSGHKIFVNNTTQIDMGIESGSHVLARGFIRGEGEFLTTEIHSLDTNTHFEFSGLVEESSGETWNISGIQITTDANTKLTGNPVRGNIVHVEGSILSTGIWVADQIEKVSVPGAFEFVGMLETIAPWKVGGVSLMVDDETQVALDVRAGLQVRVEGRILEDGTWLAQEIQNVSVGQTSVAFIGVVEKMSPWVINGLPLVVTDATNLTGNIQVNSLVWVSVKILEDGAWQVLQIDLLGTDTASSECTEFTDTIVSMDDTQVTLKNGLSIPREVAKFVGQLKVDSKVLVTVCFDANETILSAVLQVVEGEEFPTATPEPLQPPEENVTICHIPSGNPKNAQTITVASSALDAHLAHGDYLGMCQENSNANSNENNPGNGKDDKNDKGNGNNNK